MKNYLYKLSENNYLKQFMYFLIPILFAWLIIFDFNFANNFFQSDLFFLHLPTIKEKLGLPDVYNFFHLGGALHRPIYGYVPIEIFLSFFFQDEVLVMTLVSVIICILNGFLGMATIKNWSQIKINSLQKIFVFFIFCFLPISVWRITNGHLNFLFGINFFLLNSCFLSSLIKEKLNYWLYLVYFLICFNLFAQPPIAQIIFYNALFFFPIYSYIFLKFIAQRKKIFSLVGIILLAVALNWDQILLSINLQSYHEFPRSTAPAIYSYMKVSWSFLIASIFSSVDLLNTLSIPSHLYHEVNYPLGIGTIFLALYFFIKDSNKFKWYFLIFLSFSLYYFLGEWGAKEIFYNLPFFNLFRVPMRILIVINLCIYLYVIKKIIYFLPEVSKKKSFLIICGFLFLSYLPNLIIEILFFLMVILAICLNKKKNMFLFLLGILTTLNIASFKEKIVFSNFDSERYELITNAIKNENEKNTNFEKGMMFYNEENLNLNTALYFSMPSLEGYGFPLDKYLKTYSFLTNTQYQPTRVIFNNSPDESFKALNNLYNVKLFFNTNDYLGYVRTTQDTSVRSVVNVKNFNNEIEQLEFIKNHYVEFDFLKNTATSLDNEIRDLKKCIYEKKSISKEIIFELKEKSEFPCLLVLPFNYSKFLRVNDKNIDLLPIDVSLLGVFIKKKPINSMIIISSNYDFTLYIFIKTFLWGLIILLSIFYYMKESIIKYKTSV